MHGERDLYRIAGCAYTEALLYTRWSMETDLPPLPEPEELLEGAIPGVKGRRGVQVARRRTGDCPPP